MLKCFHVFNLFFCVFLCFLCRYKLKLATNKEIVYKLNTQVLISSFKEKTILEWYRIIKNLKTFYTQQFRVLKNPQIIKVTS